jgi:Icc-related predicted phosphoesterase
VRILAVSDKVDDLIYSPALKNHFGDVDLVLGCGDLQNYYLEYIVTMLGGPLFYVVGNHANAIRQRYAQKAEWEYPGGCDNIDGRVIRYRNLLVAGLEGSMRYNSNPDFQYTDREMAIKMWKLVPALMVNKMRYGRYLDILITHAAAKGIHDRQDRCHQGFRAFVTFMERFQPRYLVHGHVHVYNPLEQTDTMYGSTRVLNTFGHRTLEIDEATLE